jgi:hypothetical protein
LLSLSELLRYSHIKVVEDEEFQKEGRVNEHASLIRKES